MKKRLHLFLEMMPTDAHDQLNKKKKSIKENRMEMIRARRTKYL